LGRAALLSGPFLCGNGSVFLQQLAYCVGAGAAVAVRAL